MRLVLSSESGVLKATFTNPRMIKKMLNSENGSWYKAKISSNGNIVSRFKVECAGELNIMNGDVDIFVSKNDRLYFVNANFENVDPPLHLL
jgi:hypothetical protein